MPGREQRKQPASSPIIIHVYASSESSASLRISDAALSSPDYPLQGTNLAGDLEQLKDPARPMTRGAEEDPDAGDAAPYRAALHRPFVESAEESDDPVFGDAAHCRAALHRPDVESAAEPDDSEF